MKLKMAAIGLLLPLLASAAHAQAFGVQTVFDPAMFARQLLALQQEAMAAANDAAILQSLTTGGFAGAWQNPDQILGALGDVINVNEGISYSTGDVAQQFQRMYPGEQTIAGAEPAQASVQETLNTLQGVLASVQMQNQDFPAEAASLQTLEAENTTAAGSLQATEVTNELLLHQARENELARQLRMSATNAQVAASAARINADVQTANAQTVITNETVPGDLSNPANDTPPARPPGE